MKARIAQSLYAEDLDDMRERLISLSAFEDYEPCAATMALIVVVDLLRLSTNASSIT